MSAITTDATDEDAEQTRAGWFQAPSGWTLVALIAAVAFLAGVIGWRIAQPSHPSKSSADIGFLFDMIDHHDQAIYMSSIELANGSSRHIRVFADEIHRLQDRGRDEEHAERRVLAEVGRRHSKVDDGGGDEHRA